MLIKNSSLSFLQDKTEGQLFPPLAAGSCLSPHQVFLRVPLARFNFFLDTRSQYFVYPQNI